MLYQAYQLQNDLMAPLRLWADVSKRAFDMEIWPGVSGVATPWADRMKASVELISHLKFTHTRPDYRIRTVQSGKDLFHVTEEVVLDLPFGNLLRFHTDNAYRQPKVLIIAAMSGHFATLLRETAEVMSRDHDVYITDWKNARDVPLSAGAFGVDDYVDYLIKFMEAIGPGGHMVAVCQPCVQALVAAAVMAEDNNPATPLSMTLMAGPIDTSQHPTVVNKLAGTKPLSWFEKNLISRVPARHPGRGRRVYPGFVQLTAFMSMNVERHRSSHAKLFHHLAEGNLTEARKIKEFYDEYFAVADISAEFYLETVDRVFQKMELAKGEFTFRGRPVNPAAIRRTALLTVEGGRDDICAIGQTAAAHDLCSSLRPHLKRHHLQANVGHYGVFAGTKWENEIYPNVRNFILSME